MRKLKSKIDQITIVTSSIMLAVLMLILLVNIVLRYMPGVGGFKWYMESSQYLNVWAMFTIGISISLNMSHLNVNLLEDNVRGAGKKVVKILIAAFTILFYLGLMYGTIMLATKSRQVISTMPYFKMSHVFWFIPVAAVLSAISTAIGCYLELTDIEEAKGVVEL